MSSILFYSILSYPILFYSILFYSILFYAILFYSILYYSIQYACLYTLASGRGWSQIRRQTKNMVFFPLFELFGRRLARALQQYLHFNHEYVSTSPPSILTSRALGNTVRPLTLSEKSLNISPRHCHQYFN